METPWGCWPLGRFVSRELNPVHCSTHQVSGEGGYGSVQVHPSPEHSPLFCGLGATGRGAGWPENSSDSPRYVRERFWVLLNLAQALEPLLGSQLYLLYQSLQKQVQGSLYFWGFTDELVARGCRIWLCTAHHAWPYKAALPPGSSIRCIGTVCGFLTQVHGVSLLTPFFTKAIVWHACSV